MMKKNRMSPASTTRTMKKDAPAFFSVQNRYATQVALIVLQAVLIMLLASQSALPHHRNALLEDPTRYVAQQLETASSSSESRPDALPRTQQSLSRIDESTERRTGVSERYVNSSAANTTLQIAWLMSFPNSGTSYTLHLVRSVSQAQIATNYASMRLKRLQQSSNIRTIRTVPVLDSQPEGPFWGTEETTDGTISSLPLPKHYALTKTHCGAPCQACGPSEYIKTWHYFLGRCRRAEKLVRNGTSSNDWHVKRHFYPTTHVTKSVHLIRDPFDNVVSRWRYERHNGRTAVGYPDTREGFRDYCRNLNQDYLKDHKKTKLMQPNLVKLFQKSNVPCYADFIRYIEWHNFAFVTERDLHTSSLVVHYNDYEAETLNQTIQTLAHFLHFEIAADSTPTVFTGEHRTYRHYFTAAEQYAALQGMRGMALQETWRHLERYVYVRKAAEEESDGKVPTTMGNDHQSAAS